MYCDFLQNVYLRPCLSISDQVILPVYVDDCYCFALSEAYILVTIKKIKYFGLEINAEDDLSGFMGIYI